MYWETASGLVVRVGDREADPVIRVGLMACLGFKSKDKESVLLDPLAQVRPGFSFFFSLPGITVYF